MNINHAFIVLSTILVSACADTHRAGIGLVDFNHGAVGGSRIVRESGTGEPNHEQNVAFSSGSTVVLDAVLVSCFPLSGVNGPSTNEGYAQAAFFFVVRDVHLGQWIGNTLSIESADSVSASNGNADGLGAGFYTLRDKYRFYLSSTTVQTSGIVRVRRLTDTTATLPDRGLPEGWEPVKDPMSDKEIPEGVPVKGIKRNPPITPR